MKYPYYEFAQDKYEARYWNPGNANICVIASVTKGIDWAAYIGANPNAYKEQEALQWALEWGAKLSRQDAEYFFPEIKLPYRY